MMQLYHSPFTCALTTRLACAVSGQPVECLWVSLQDKTLEDGSDYRRIHPSGKVPALRCEDGAVLSEGPVLLQYIAMKNPESGLLPPASDPRHWQMLSTLSFIATEIHKDCLYPLFNRDLDARQRADCFARLHVALGHLTTRLQNCCSEASVNAVDCYVVWVLLLLKHLNVSLNDWPFLQAQATRLLSDSRIRAVLADEQQRHQSPAVD